MSHLKRQQVEYCKESYPPGTRILLIHMGSDPRPVEDDMKGTVRCVDDIGTIHCDFDNGRRLGIIPKEESCTFHGHCNCTISVLYAIGMDLLIWG